MTTLPRGRCPVCGREVALRVNGTVREHWPPAAVAGGPRALSSVVPCDGSGMPAAEVHEARRQFARAVQLLREGLGDDDVLCEVNLPDDPPCGTCWCCRTRAYLAGLP